MRLTVQSRPNSLNARSALFCYVCNNSLTGDPCKISRMPSTTYTNLFYTLVVIGGLFVATNFIKGLIMATKQELIDGLTSVSSALDKIGGETTSLVTKVAELEAALANVENIPADVMALLDEVKAKVANVDSMVTDATPTDPAPVDPAEPTEPTA